MFTFLILPNFSRTSINKYVSDDLYTAEIVAHEIGHNLNMEHDFGKDESKTRFCKTDNSACTGINGIMDYWYPNHGLTLIWTCCSRYDYTIYFNQKNVRILISTPRTKIIKCI